MLYPDGIDWRSLPTTIDPGPANSFRLTYYEKKAAIKIMRYNLTSATTKNLYSRADFRYFFMGANLIWALFASGNVYAAQHIIFYLQPLELAFLTCLLPSFCRQEIAAMPHFKNLFTKPALYLPGCLYPPLLDF